MPDIFAETLRDFRTGAATVVSGIEHLMPHHGQSQAPATQPVNLQAPPEGDPVSLFTDAIGGMHAAVAKLETLDADAVSALETISANPGAKAVFDALAAVTHVSPDFLQLAANTLADLGNMFPKPAQAAAAAVAAQ